jgi:RNA recognition motif-containing protein
LQFLAVQALAKTGSVLGEFPIRVSPSKTAIVPVNNSYLPRSNEERELVARTVFVGNIDRVVEREQLKDFFENLCGECAEGTEHI